MPKRRWLIRASVLALIVVSALVGFAVNSTPTVPTVALNDAATATRPFVVKLHARWCPVCMFAKGTWSKLQETYADRVNLVVFDLTSGATTEASRAEAKRLGLDAFFAEHSGQLGSIYVLDGVSKEVRGSASGLAKLADYSAMIDEALQAKRPEAGMTQ